MHYLYEDNRIAAWLEGIAPLDDNQEDNTDVGEYGPDDDADDYYGPEDQESAKGGELDITAGDRANLENDDELVEEDEASYGVWPGDDEGTSIPDREWS